MEETLLAEYRLDNGIKIHLYDLSRRVAGDRWQVVLLVRAQVPLVETVIHNADLPEEQKIRLTGILGQSLTWEQKRERNFIDEKEKPAVLEAMVQRFKTQTRPYVAHPEFASGVTARRLTDELSKLRRHDMMEKNNG